jgi:hypothetical protein
MFRAGPRRRVIWLNPVLTSESERRDWRMGVAHAGSAFLFSSLAFAAMLRSMTWWSRLRKWLSPNESDREIFLGIIKERDDQNYSAIFGKPYRSAIATVTPELLGAILPSFNPSWAHAGVYVFEPSPGMPFWTYVTAGLSTPWHLTGVSDLPSDRSEARSGLGFELLLRTTEFDDWAIGLLNRLIAYQLGVTEGLLNGSIIAVNQRIPLQGLCCVQAGSSVEAIVITEPRDLASSFTLRSGAVSLLQIIGVTREEYAWSVEHGVEALVEALSIDQHLVTAFNRPSIPAAQRTVLPESLRRHFISKS